MASDGLCECGCGCPAPIARRNRKDHPRANKYTGYVLDHILIAEKALGKPLPPGAQVHHHSPEQLVVCQDDPYHKLLHQRTRALKTCGHANWRKCKICKKYDDPINLHRNGTSSYHNECARIYNKMNRERRMMNVGS